MQKFKYKLSDFIDVDSLSQTFRLLYSTANIPNALIDIDGKILASAGWQKICTEFHRNNPESEALCVESDTHISAEIAAGEPYCIYECKLGLVDSSCPVIIDGHHLGNLFTGQMFHTPLTEERRNRFRAQANQFGYDEQAYMEALEEVPVFPLEKHEEILKLLANLAEQLGNSGLARLREIEQSERLKISQERFDLAMSATKDGVFDWNLVTNEIYYSPVWKSMLGYKDDELPNDFSIWEKLTKPEDVKASWEMQQELINKQRDRFEMEFQMLHKDGHWVDILSRAKAVFDARGEAIRIVGTHIDITYRKLAEAAIEESEHKYRLMIQNSTDITLLQASDGRPTFISPQIETILGYKPKEFKTVNIFDLVHPDDLELTIKANERAFEGNELIDFEYRVLHKDGQYRWLAHTARPRIIGGVLESVHSSIKDITERKQVEQSLRKSEAIKNTMVSNIGDVITIIDQIGINQYKSPNVTKIFGWKPEELVGQSTWDNVHPDDLEQGKSFFGSLLEEANKTGTTELRYKRKDGSYSYIQFTGVNLFHDPDINGILGNYHDITKRKQVEKAHRQSEERFRKMFHYHDAIMLMIDPDDGKITNANHSAESFYGYTKEELCNLRIQDINQLTSEKVAEERQNALNQQRNYFIFPHKLKSGRVRTVEVHSTPMQFDNKAMLFSIIHDITDREQAEAKNRQQKYYLEKSQELGKIGTWELDLRENILRWTDENCRIFGVPPGSLVDYEIFISKIHPGDREYVNREWMAGLAGNPYDIEHRLLIEGVTTWVREKADITFDEDGEAVSAIGFTQDITERKLAELTLVDKEYLLLKSQQVAHIGSYVLDVATGQWDSSVTLDLIFGIDADFPKDVTGWIKIIHSEDQGMMQEYFTDNVLTKHESFNKEYRIKRIKDGRVAWVHGMGELELDADGNPIRMIGTIQDISSRKKAEQGRVELEAELRQVQKLEALGTMVGGISHELNNILQSLFLYGGLVKDDLPEDNELRANFDQMLKDGERAKNIVNQILAFSRKSNVDMQPHLMHEIVLESLVLERASLPANIELKQDIDSDCGLVLCDRTQIHQIILNLCNNAQHAMEAKGGTLTVRLKQIQTSMKEKAPEATALELTVIDTGHGIRASELEKIFDPFYTTKQLGLGTGLGLSAIHGIVEMMEGQISVKSEPGEGTTFRILFPVTTTSREEADPKSAGKANIVSHSILLIDDEDGIRNAAQSVLASMGHLVDSASDGKQALQLFKANPGKYDLIITDQSMPKMSGVELTRAIRKANSEIPIILSTGQLGIEDEEDFKENGVTAFIQKPWTAEELIDMIQEIDFK